MNHEGATNDHRLDGLEPDNLLAFLALLGLLHALEEAAPTWRPRVRWSVDEPPLRPVLETRVPVAADDVAQCAERGVCAVLKRHEFGALKDLNVTGEEMRCELRSRRDTPAGAVWASLGSDAAVKDSGTVESTPYCTIFGQGHQHFLERLRVVPGFSEPPRRGRGRKARTLTGAETLAEALFEPWERIDQTKSFRWDPEEDVRYAHRHANPSEAATKAGTQYGANRLAAIAIGCLPAVPVVVGRKVRVLARGTARNPMLTAGWPIWKEGASLAAILAMLDGTKEIDAVRTRWYRTQRFSQGKFMNWRVAETERDEA